MPSCASTFQMLGRLSQFLSVFPSWTQRFLQTLITSESLTRTRCLGQEVLTACLQNDSGLGLPFQLLRVFWVFEHLCIVCCVCLSLVGKSPACLSIFGAEPLALSALGSDSFSHSLVTDLLSSVVS